MTPEYEKTLALEESLLEDAQTLAKEIRRRPSQRNATLIQAGWATMDAKRPKLNSLYRSIRKVPTEPRSALNASGYAAQKRLVETTKRVKRCLTSWDSMARLVQNHIDPKAVPLATHRPLNPSDRVLSTLHAALHLLANPLEQDQTSVDQDYFADIPLPIQMFDTLMQSAYRLLLAQGRADRARFLDVGCGGGVTLLTAHNYFRFCDGLEFDPGYVTAARRTLSLLNKPNISVIEGNALTFDGYAPYDVVYFYRPLHDDTLMLEMEHRILDAVAPGTVILAPYTNNHFDPRPGFPAAQITGPIFVAGLAQAQADVLHAEAQRTTTDLIKRPRHYLFDTGFWTPLLDVATQNGG